MNRITSSDGTSPLGGALALEAAARGLPVTRLAVWEPPYYLDDEPRRPPADYRPGHPDAGW